MGMFLIIMALGWEGCAIVGDAVVNKLVKKLVNKLVLLKFVGRSIEAGFQVTLQIGAPQARPMIDQSASLPANPDLAIALQNWRQAYQQVDFSGRWKMDGAVGTRVKGKPGEVLQPIDRKGLCQTAAQMLAQQFNQWLRSPEFQPLREVWLESLYPDDRIQVLIQTDCHQLQQLPWHLWDLVDRDERLEIAIAALNYQTDELTTERKPHRHVKILAILGDASGIDIQADRQLLESLPDTDVKFLASPKRSDLSEKLWTEPIDIFFFAGHSSTQGEAGRIFINEAESLTLDELRYALKKAIAQGLQLAIFNSCDGLGLANTLADLQIPQIIVMREPVPDRVAQTFLQFFLSSFSQNMPLPEAVRQARERLQGLEGDYPSASWLPILVQHPIALPPTWSSLLGQRDRLPFWSPPPWKWLPIAAMVSSVAVLGIRHLGGLQNLELAAYDQVLQWRPAEPQDNRILIIEVTEADVKAQGNESRRGSLSDQRLLKLLDILTPLEPAAIGLDIYRDYPANPKLPKLIQYLNNDAQLVGVCRSLDPVSKLPAIEPPPEVNPVSSGFSNLVLDSDLSLRRHLLALTPVPNSSCMADYALSTQLALRYLSQRGHELDFKDQDWIWGARQFKVLDSHSGGYQGIDAWGHQILVNYRHYRSIEDAVPRITLAQALDRQFNPNAVKNKIILIGTTAESFKDLITTPFRQNGRQLAIPGVVMQAQLTSQLISHVLDRRPLIKPLPLWIDGLWIVGWAIVGVGIGCIRRGRWLIAGLLGAGLFVMVGYGIGLAIYAIWLPGVPAIASLGLGCALLRSTRSQQHRLPF